MVPVEASLIGSVTTAFMLTPLSRDTKIKSLHPVIAVDTVVVWQAVSQVTAVVTVDFPDLDAFYALGLLPTLGALEILFLWVPLG